MDRLPNDAPPPRLCVIEKREGEAEYGYNLHAEKGRGQFVGMVDAGSAAARGGLQQGDRIFAVNGHSIVGENHKKVVDRIKQDAHRCEMLVVSEEGAKWYADHGIPVTLQLPNIVRGDEIQHSAGAPPVFVPPPPPTTHNEVMTSSHKPLPHLAKLDKSTPLDEFGFNLHAEKNRGHFIGTVDAGGIGERAGLRMGQRIVGVNGLLVYPNTPHKEVVALIKKSPLSTSLLVASEEVDKWHRANNVEYSFDEVENTHESKRQTTSHVEHVEHVEPHVEEHKKTNGFDVVQTYPHSIQVNEEKEIHSRHESAHGYPYQETQPDIEPYNPYTATVADDDLINQVFGSVQLPETTHIESIHVLSRTIEATHENLSSSASTVSRESAVDVPNQYVPSYNTTSHNHSNEHDVDHRQNGQRGQTQQPSPMSNGSSNDYAASSVSGGYDEDDIYHLSAKEARERLRNRNRKQHPHDMSLNEKYQLVSNM